MPPNDDLLFLLMPGSLLLVVLGGGLLLSWLAMLLPRLALVLAVVFGGGAALVSIATLSPVALGVSLLILPTVVVVAGLGAGSVGRWQALGDTLSSVLWASGVLVVVVLSTAMLGLAGFIASSVYLGGLWFWVSFGRSARLGEDLEIVSMLAATTRGHLPLAETVTFAAEGRTARVGRTFRRLGHWLSRGSSLADAIHLGYPACPGHVRSAVAQAQQLHQLPRALDQAERELVGEVSRRVERQPVHPGYALMVLCAVAMVSSGLMVFVLPKFLEILLDMGTPLPWGVRASMDFVHWGRSASSGLLGGLALGVTGFLYTRFRARRPERFQPLAWAGDVARWHVPILRRLERHRSMARLLEHLALAIRTGVSMEQALDQARRLDLNACYRRRVVRWYRRVARGQDVSASARAARVGRPVAAAMDPAMTRLDLPDVLETLAGACRSREEYVSNLARGILLPLTTLVLAAPVAMIAWMLITMLSAILRSAVQGTP
jgi:type II secretory pathway component PulF